MPAIVALDVLLLIGLGWWSARGGRRPVVGLLASLLFGALVGVPIYVVSYFASKRLRAARGLGEPG